MKTIKSYKLIIGVSLLVGGNKAFAQELHDEEVAQCLDHDLIVQNGCRLCVNKIIPASTDKENPCECDPSGQLCLDGKVKIKNKLLVNTITPLYVDGCGECVEDNSKKGQICFTQDVHTYRDLQVCDDVKIKKDLVVNGEAILK